MDEIHQASMKTPARSLCLLATAVTISASLSACVLPYHFTDAPAVAGQVVSRATNRPVAGATVSMTADKDSVQTRTDQDGSFRLPSLQYWGTVAYPTDGFVDGSGDLHVVAFGYQTHTEEVGSFDSIARLRRTRTELKHIHIVLVPNA